jgi:hypothetical protein
MKTGAEKWDRVLDQWMALDALMERAEQLPEDDAIRLSLDRQFVRIMEEVYATRLGRVGHGRILRYDEQKRYMAAHFGVKVLHNKFRYKLPKARDHVDSWVREISDHVLDLSNVEEWLVKQPRIDEATRESIFSPYYLLLSFCFEFVNSEETIDKLKDIVTKNFG